MNKILSAVLGVVAGMTLLTTPAVAETAPANEGVRAAADGNFYRAHGKIVVTV